VAVSMLARLRDLTARTRIGLDVEPASDGSTVVRAVAARGTRVRWRSETRLDADEPLAPTLAAFLRTLPGGHWPRPEVIVALGPASVQLKRLPGLPPLTDPTTLTAAIRENACRFFLRNGIPIMTSALRIDGPGDAWGAAAEQPVLESLEAACHAAQFRLRAIVPAAAVLGAVLIQAAPRVGRPRRGTAPPTPGTTSPAATDSTSIVWPIGSVGTATHALTYTLGRLVGVRRLRPSERKVSGDAAADLPPSMSGSDAWPFAAAFGAAAFGHREPIAWHPATPSGARASRAHTRIAVASCALAVVAAITAPGLASTVAASRATRHLHTVGIRRDQALRAADSVARATEALREAAAFADSRHALTVLLAALTDALPPRSALVAFHTDSAAGTLVALTPNASALVVSLERIPGIVAPELVGPVTAEPIQGPGSATPLAPTASPRTLDRVTVRFRFSPSNGRDPMSPGNVRRGGQR
jgi:hypothetical protein